MAKLSEGTKQRLSTVINASKFVAHWGFIPTILYLGFRKGADEGMPPLSFFNLLWL